MNKEKFSFKILKEFKEARVGKINTHRGHIDTPTFMTVGTQGTVKASFIDDVIKDLNLQIDAGIDDEDNIGIGTKNSINQVFKKNKICILPSLTYEYITKQFSFIERTRELEFDRNWNLNNNPGNQQLVTLSLNTSFDKKSKFNYSFEKMKFLNSNKIRNSLYGLIQKDSFIINLSGNILTSFSDQVPLSCKIYILQSFFFI